MSPPTTPAGPPIGALISAPIGVFDSGIGGLSVLCALLQELPEQRFIYLADSGFAPYGERGDVYVTERSRACTQWLASQGCQMVVVACNTATAAAIHVLRAQWPQLAWVGIEPALKPAVAATQTGHVAVLATRGTLESRKYAALAAQHGAQVQVSSLPCDGLADAIERGDDAQTATIIIAACAMMTWANGQSDPQLLEKQATSIPPQPADVVVLGCTHYPLVMPLWQAHLPPTVQIIDPAQAVARQAVRLLAAQGTGPANTSGRPRLQFATTGDLTRLQAAVARYMGPQATSACQAVQIPTQDPTHLD